MKGLFVSEDYIKENTPINDNVDVKLLKMAMIEAQEVRIMEAIGTGLYNDLSTKVIADPTLSAYPNDLALMKLHIRPTLRYWTLVHVAPMLLFKLTNKSVSTSNSDNSTPTDFSNVRVLSNEYKSLAEIYEARLLKYLHDNYTLFPTFDTGTGTGAIYSKEIGFSTDWDLGF